MQQLQQCTFCQGRPTAIGSRDSLGRRLQHIHSNLPLGGAPPPTHLPRHPSAQSCFPLPNNSRAEPSLHSFGEGVSDIYVQNIPKRPPWPVSLLIRGMIYCLQRKNYIRMKMGFTNSKAATLLWLGGEERPLGCRGATRMLYSKLVMRWELVFLVASDQGNRRDVCLKPCDIPSGFSSVICSACRPFSLLCCTHPHAHTPSQK